MPDFLLEQQIGGEVCGILLAGRYPIRRDRCGEHQQEELEL